MAILKSISIGLLLSLTACVDASQEPDTTTTDHEIGVPPHCPPNSSLIYWLESSPSCYTCVDAAGMPGHRANEYAACTHDIPGTKKLIRANLCVEQCELL